MSVRIELLLVLVFAHVLLTSCQNVDIVYLQALKDNWQNTPPNWVGSDPCGDKWDGITCTDSRVTSMSLNSNGFTGNIPPSIGNLSKLYWLDLADNKLSGSIPVSDGTTPGLDLLVNTKHFHFGKNRLSGEIPSKLFSSEMTLKHVLFEDNQLEGTIPLTLGLVQTLEVLIMQDTGLQGVVPTEIFSIPQIETVVLSDNGLNGTLDFGAAYSTHLQLIDLSNNSISAVTQRGTLTANLILLGNLICLESEATVPYCNHLTESNSSYTTPPNNCMPPTTCGPDQTSSPNCKCSYPYTGILSFRAPSFSDLGNSSIYTSLQSSMMVSFESNQLPVDSISLSNPNKNSDNYLLVSLEIFPSGGERFNRSGISRIGFILSNQTYKPPHSFGPYFFIGNNYDFFSDAQKGKHKSVSIGLIIGVAAGGCFLVLLLVVAGLYAFRQKGRAERATKKNSPFASWDPDKGSGGCPQLKGARSFTFEELKTCTNNFTATANIGSGGYGMVYRGSLPNGQLVAIKRSQQGSTQGANEFKTEIELLSRVHHKNVVSLIGFCFDQGEQMLVYEYIVNGTLKDSLSGNLSSKK
ncbi:leucine-rich repeat protein kinase family protein [Artemisia annua]|uniref:non-specific serine/threonine protein kinase n=1 Tax=Artemisia annua TaxID=35608 RepID=A0A2U1P9K6_ARTAN|nr:leucine-rich repeat protein kinase family protein [Artemisia annua]